MKKRFNPLKAIIPLVLCLTMLTPVLPAATAYASGLDVNLVPDYSFESANINGWVYDEGYFSIGDRGMSISPTGRYYAILSDGGNAYLDITPILAESDYYFIDTGALEVTYSMYAAQTAPKDGAMYLEFIDGSDNSLGNSPGVVVDSRTGFNPSSTVACDVPEGTRMIRLRLSNPNGPGDIGLLADNLSVVLSKKSPYVYAVTPADGTVNIEPSMLSTTGLTVGFNETVAKLAGDSEAYFKIYDDEDNLCSTAIGSNVIIDGSDARIVHFTFPDTLDDTHTYRIQLEADVLQGAGGDNNHLMPYTAGWWTISTGDFTSPSVIALDPSNGSHHIMPDGTYSIDYNEIVNAVTGHDIIISDSTGPVRTIDAADTTQINIDNSSGSSEVQIKPTLPLSEESSYNISVPAGAFEDTSGNPSAAITGSTEWAFFTDRCTVRFDTRGGTPAPADQFLYPREHAARPADPALAGYTFGGWYSSLDFTSADQWDFASSQVTDDTTLYAKWIGARIRVATSSTRRGTVSGGNYYPLGSTATVTATPKSGYYFRRWVKSSSVVSTDWQYSFTVTGSATLRADFAKIGTTRLSAASTGSDSIKLTWKAVTGASGYKVQRRIGRTGIWTEIADIPAGTLTYTDTALTCGLRYYFRVRAYYTSGITTYGHYSYVKSAIPGTKVTVYPSSSRRGTVAGGGYYPLGTPVTLTAVPKSGNYFLNWTISGTVTSTDPEYGLTVAGPVKLKANFAGIRTPYIRSAVSADHDSITLTWRAVAGAAGYEVFQREGRTGAWAPVASTGAETLTHTITGLTCGQRYYYKVRAYCVTGSLTTTGSYSSIRYATPVPSKPAGLLAEVTSPTSIKLSWGAVDGAAKYLIYRSTSRTGTYRYQGETIDSVLDFSQDGLVTGRAYYYKVRAVYIDGLTTVYGELSEYTSVRPS